MTTEITTLENATVVKVSGIMMGGPETKECHDKVKSLISSGCTNLVVDLSGAEWVNSRGMGILIACYVTSHNAGGDIRFASLTKKTRMLFHMMKLDTVFPIFDTVDQAIASF
jgi:anti-sigma B factor antagonist